MLQLARFRNNNLWRNTRIMDSVKKYYEMQQDTIDKESLYLCSEIERALERIISYTDDLDDRMFSEIKKPAIKLLKEWHL